MQRKKAPNSGWAAVDRKWRGTDGGGNDVDINSFPDISGSRPPSSTSSSVAENSNRPKTKPFASVVRPSAEFVAVSNGNKHLTDDTQSTIFCVSSASDNKIKLLKDAHSWADSNLIEDVLAGVNNDVDEASALLKAMVSPETSSGEDRTTGQLAFDMSKTHDLASGNDTEDNKHPNESHMLPLRMNMFSVPLEPEFEELEDDYLNHRKDALKMMRAATKHSQAASNAFLRGDHAAAKELSLKAQEERSAAEKLNNKAAEEIFHLRNSNDDIWKVDMHGLHASEAVDVLQRHLHMIEFQQPGNTAASTDKLAKSEPTVASSNIVNTPDKMVLFRPRQAVLEVITGIGNHSKGQASLPVAIRGFLIENGYRFDELRPGVLYVRPKFRRR